MLKQIEIKDEGVSKEGIPYCGYCNGKAYEEESLYFVDKCLEGVAYSYEISSSGVVTLTEEQTFEVYKTMKEYYEGLVKE